ncbi:hypothetical protein [uncultured Microbacterium sp.]|uniref:hypothetical protein n=1 Tax=uncultured Microbacterium sp. TaxID=191216 RepID=UPI0025E1A154|nr:hypothetical protein [uncultured Microbacterium sp.]
MSEDLGCQVCLTHSGKPYQPRFVLATSPSDLLYRCDFCRTWWIGTQRYQNPVSSDVARAAFPEARLDG